VIPIAMLFHHAIGRSNAANDMIWAKTAHYVHKFGDFGSADLVGMFAYLYAILFTIVVALVGMFIASKILKKSFNSIFYDLGYSYAPLFILGSIAHTLEMFFIKGYKNIVEGIAYGFGFSLHVSALATRGDSWLHMFGLLKWIAAIWALIVLYKRFKHIDATKLKKFLAFPFAASLIIFFIGVNAYTGYVFATYGRATSGHSHHGGKMFQSVPENKATILQTGKDKSSCAVCGMNLPKYYKTGHVAKSGTKIRQYCSIHCLAEEKNIKKLPLHDFKVVDTNSLKFIDAKKAFYVIGSKKKGTMSPISKYAFLNKKEAIKFSKRYGGKIYNFDEALKIATKDFINDMVKKPSPKDVIYLTDLNPSAKNSIGSHGHMHGGGGGWTPRKKVWPIFYTQSKNLNCLGKISGKLYLLDTNQNISEIKPSRDRGCKAINFKVPNNGYYNLFYTNKIE